ncbi:sulfotransferase family protein [Futiania mangrovi]|uniref:Sulfotransferase family protein n=1 Tax=Futiania mangrovi TaxID=2959716 RepID=A0A9J6PCJ0_9PROT|nr:sulfotransferase family protein [Futiania mangrovii]MCP1336281.1 sulfotransferase family protein [Futiania mangrovii]
MALEVIGAGFGRTGTNSLRLALERLGFGPCHHMFEVRDNPEQLPAWEAAARGEKVDWDEAFKGYRAQVDWPGAAYWRQLAEHYPDARVILSVRAPDDWFDSVQATIGPFMTTMRGKHAHPHMNAIAEMCGRFIVQDIFDGRIDDREHAIAVFKAHTKEVRDTISPERLLVYETGSGWGPLCAFLGVPEPDNPYPMTNSSKEFQARHGGEG